MLRSPEAHWTLVVWILLTAAIVAIWPSPTASPGHGGGHPAGTPDLAGRTAPVPDDTALAPLRRRAALAPCPAAAPGGVQAVVALAGIAVPCLGAPGRIDLGAGLGGRAALLTIWASWCQPCRQEIPVLARYAAQPGAAVVVGINVQDRPEAALRLLIDLGAHYPSVTDPNAQLLAALHAPPLLPVSYVVSP